MSLFCRCFQCQICLCSSRAWFMAQQVGQISIAVFFSTRCTRVYLFLHKENRIKEFKRKHFIVQKRFSGSNFNCDRPFFSLHRFPRIAQIFSLTSLPAFRILSYENFHIFNFYFPFEYDWHHYPSKPQFKATSGQLPKLDDTSRHSQPCADSGVVRLFPRCGGSNLSIDVLHSQCWGGVQLFMIW